MQAVETRWDEWLHELMKAVDVTTKRDLKKKVRAAGCASFTQLAKHLPWNDAEDRLTMMNMFTVKDAEGSGHRAFELSGGRKQSECSEAEVLAYMRAAEDEHRPEHRRRVYAWLTGLMDAAGVDTLEDLKQTAMDAGCNSFTQFAKLYVM